jgi:transposase
VDLAKNVIQLHGVDSMGRVVIRKAISRQKFLEWFANLAPCLVAMEGERNKVGAGRYGPGFW